MRLRWAVIFCVPTLLLVAGMISVQRAEDARVGSGADALGLLGPDLGSHPDARCVGSAIRHAGVSAESRLRLSGSMKAVPDQSLPPRDQKPWRKAMTVAREGCPDPGFIPARWRGLRIEFSV